MDRRWKILGTSCREKSSTEKERGERTRGKFNGMHLARVTRRQNDFALRHCFVPVRIRGGGGKRMADYFHAQRVSAATEIIHKVIPALHDPGHTRVFESFLPLVFFIKT